FVGSGIDLGEVLEAHEARGRTAALDVRELPWDSRPAVEHQIDLGLVALDEAREVALVRKHHGPILDVFAEPAVGAQNHLPSSATSARTSATRKAACVWSSLVPTVLLVMARLLSPPHLKVTASGESLTTRKPTLFV